MKELELKYGCNPNQKPASIFMSDGSDLPIKVLSGKPGYINFLDAFNSWQLVKELKEATNKPCAASFKHVSPAGVALAKELTDIEKKVIERKVKRKVNREKKQLDNLKSSNSKYLEMLEKIKSCPIILWAKWVIRSYKWEKRFPTLKVGPMTELSGNCQFGIGNVLYGNSK